MYSQNSEEEVILKYFGNYIGVFCDLGCNDGVTFSNTRQLALNGWGGILVDSSPSAMIKTNRLYAGVERFDMFQFALSNKDGEATFYESGEHAGLGDTGLVSSLNQEETYKWKAIGNKFTEIQVKTLRWDTLLSRSQYKTIDMFSIDCEGAEWSFLKDINFDALDTRLVCIEWNSINKGIYESFFNARGFHLIHTSAENLIYVK